MGLGGFEPPTSPLSGVRSNQLSYRPDYQKSHSEAAYYTQAGCFYNRIRWDHFMVDHMTIAQKKSLESLIQGRAIESSSDLLALLKALNLSYELTPDGAEVFLSERVKLVSTDLIRAALPSEIAYEHHWVIDSTNKYLMSQSHHNETRVCSAEMQISGRGRRGRSWLSPFGKNIYLSWLSTIERPMSELAGLSLAVGLRSVLLLRRLGCLDIGLKWPNDLMTIEGKIGGILIELEAVTRQRTRVCIGLGLNVLSAPDKEHIGQAASCLANYGTWDRTELIIELVNELKTLVENFDPNQMVDIQKHWSDVDIYKGRVVSVIQNSEAIEGVNEGIDLLGQLVLNCGEGRRYFNAGEVTMRVPESL